MLIKKYVWHSFTFDTQTLTCITDLELMERKICRYIKYRIKREQFFFWISRVKRKHA